MYFQGREMKETFLALLLSSIYFAKAQASELTKFYLVMTGPYFGRVEQNVL